MAGAGDGAGRTARRGHLDRGDDVDRNPPLPKKAHLVRVGLGEDGYAALDLGRVGPIGHPVAGDCQGWRFVFMPAYALEIDDLIEHHLRDEERGEQEERSGEARRFLSFVQGGFDSVWVVPGQMTLAQALQTYRLSGCDE